MTENSLNSDSPSNLGFVSHGVACLHGLNALDASRVKVLCSHSQRREPGARTSVAAALAHTTEYARTTVPVLLKFLQDTNAGVRAAACSTLLRYAQSTNVDLQLRVTAVRAALPCIDEENRWRALATVQKLGPAAAPALSEIVRFLSDPKERIRGKAAEAIAALGLSAAPAKSALEAIREDEWGFVRDAVEAALKNIAAGSSQP